MEITKHLTDPSGSKHLTLFPKGAASVFLCSLLAAIECAGDDCYRSIDVLGALCQHYICGLPSY